ncbi:hypothetical protein CV093_17970 [Oceanobacillus sp. 143]|uniref:Uncharacterized protein n=1 Tax=Oceanobacillus zhaokaii TaxID=2052660 RepID=A0A345PKE7_9BACI|nr:hypothetical protein [Oceanobacillus zhaokaii]AXI10477.1 hypothetical protein CUC15_16725 [Oceanobacillus zhaokaii]QGS69488.1 hypothetical protein CV093_17970 [Oceanobacillus sp. 143]
MSGASLITAEMIARYYDLNKLKKEIDSEMSQLKKQFHAYFDEQVGVNTKGEITNNGFKLQRQIRKVEKFVDDLTVTRLEELNMDELIYVEKKPDDEKINAAISLGLLNEEDISDCRMSSFSGAISVKEV